MPQHQLQVRGRLGPDFVAVISPERTAGTAVAESIRAVFPGTQSLHVHYLDGRKRRPPARDEREAGVQAAKHAAEARVRAALADGALERLVVAVERDPVERITSSLWYVRGWRLSELYDPGRDTFDPRAADIVSALVDGLLAKHHGFAEDVYRPLGLPPRPGPGLWRSADGAHVWILAHSDIETQFRRMTAEAFGYPVRLLRLNGAEQFGKARAYSAFRRLCRSLLPEISQPPQTSADPSLARTPDTPAIAAKRIALEREEAGDVEGQTRAWREVLALAPEDLQAHARLSELLAAQGQAAEAAVHLEALARVRPGLAKPWLRLAEGLMAAGDVQAELEARRRALELGADGAKQRSRIARLLIDLGRQDEAREMITSLSPAGSE